MSSNDEVLFHELYWPRISGKMQRRGMYRRCGCAGCPPCRDAARRMLRGIVRSPQQSVPFRPDVWGDRYRVFSRALGERRFNVLTDMSGQPTVVDVNVNVADGDGDGDASAADTRGIADNTSYGNAAHLHDAPDIANVDGQEEVALGSLLAQRLPIPSATLKDKVEASTKLIFTGPISVLNLNQNGGRLAIPSSPGIYLAQWANGQYLGKADNLRARISEHLQAINRFVTNPRLHRFYYCVTNDPRAAEHQILNTLVALLGPSAGKVVQHFRLLGMTNKQTELGGQ